MTQELFKNREMAEKERLDTQEVKALSLWRRNAENFRTLPSTYASLLEEKKAAGIKPVNYLTKAVLADYPKIPLFEFRGEEDAKRYILKARSGGWLDEMIEEIEFTLANNYSYNTIKQWIKDTQFVFSKRQHETEKKAALRRKKPDVCIFQ